MSCPLGARQSWASASSSLPASRYCTSRDAPSASEESAMSLRVLIRRLTLGAALLFAGPVKAEPPPGEPPTAAERKQTEERLARLLKQAEEAETAGKYDEARAARGEELDLQTRLHGASNWLVTDAK